jgi:putative hydrolase of the HAD superfamily
MRQDLWIDADDTLWENNVFFERVFGEFVDLLNHSSLSAAQIRSALDEIEHVNNKIHGYGAANFVRNLTQCYRSLCGDRICKEELAQIAGYTSVLAEHPMELIEGVEKTLAYLADRHDLTLCTKGNPEEQRAKIERSGLARHFTRVRIVREKDADCYRTLLAERGRDHAECWMIGNSPKSDINPALEAGINAVYIPHPHTWHLEHMEVPTDHERLLVLERFPDLARHF